MIQILTLALVMGISAPTNAGPTVLKSPRHSFRFVLPDSLLDRKEEISTLVDHKVVEFLDQCGKWRPVKRCQNIVRTYRMIVVDDFSFYSSASSTGLASGEHRSSEVRVSLYNRFYADSQESCPAMYRDRQGQYELSGKNEYWLKHPSAYFCANPRDLLPAFVHELCHNFGAKVGHASGKEDCQPVK
jgi:hypothetical protein